MELPEGVGRADAGHVDGLPAPERDPLLGTLVATLDERARLGADGCMASTVLVLTHP